MSQRYEKLKTLLNELFQLDQPDLDFGLYRVMHAKSVEVSQFLENDLLPQVKAVFKQYKYADKADLEKNLSELIAGVEAAGMNPDDSPRITDIKTRLETAVDFAALESEVYDHLYRFFKRYYSEGDFLAKRVYKPGVYATPYEGEEVAFHWANKDQYYIKTCEYLRDYAFRLRPEDEVNPMRVHFRLVDGTEGEHSNVKAVSGKDRKFVLAEPGDSGHDFIAEENDGTQNPELVISFNFRPSTLSDWPAEERGRKKRPPTQKDLVDLAVKRILDVTDLSRWITELGTPHMMAGGEQANYCRLEAHLRRYTARNTFDFFIHKDLDNFLRRELDFYIKNEVMYLDDVENESILRVERYLSKIKVIRMIAGKIIDFLVQIEEFQKKLWLKKKFVVETHYCIAVGCIPEEFYPEIAANEAQREEWVTLYSIDQINGDLITPGYSSELSPEFLDAYPTLVVDTRNFDDEFTDRILESIGSIDEQVDGVLFHSENFQALSLLRAKFQEQVKCIYIDPPYNTEKDRSQGKFLYKDGYDYSTWLAMMHGRVILSWPLLTPNGCQFVSIDDVMYSDLFTQLSQIFGRSNHIATVIWEKVHTRKNSARYFSVSHDYIPCFAQNKTTWDRVLMPRGDTSAYSNPDGDPRGPWKPDPVYANNFYSADYVIAKPNGTKLRPPPGQYWRLSEASWNSKVVDDAVVWGEGNAYPMVKRFLADVQSGLVPVTLFKRTFAGDNSRANAEIDALFGPGKPFKYPKPTLLIKRLIQTSVRRGKKEVVLDYFAGSGTTGHAVINLNQEDEGQRKFILVEMGDYFDTVLLPRLKKVTFAPEWKDGRPVRHAKPEEAAHSPRIVKVLRLESYEDVLNNLEVHRSETQQSLLDTSEAQNADGFREQYILRYMLDVETRGSQSLLNTQDFIDPTAYKLKVKRPGSDESREVNVDLIETFNWLIGLNIGQISAPQSYIASFKRDEEKRLRLEGHLEQEESGAYWFRTVMGTMPDGRRAIVIWRKLTDDPEKDNLVLDEWFTICHLDSGSEFEVVWVNSGNNLENLKTPGDLWKVRLIEEDFHRLMFDTEGP